MTLIGLSTHLWQSTLFVLVAGLLTLTVRQERARVRYWIWLAASIKFLIPFAWLCALGRQFAATFGMEVTRGHRLYMAIEVMAGAAPAAISGRSSNIAVLTAVWLCGMATVIAWWCVRWKKVSSAIRQSDSPCEGREVQALRRVEHTLGVRRPMEVVRSPAASEPGVFGIARPVLLWPEGISGRLGDAELEAILTHEVRHVQRRDNLTAGIHMMVEAIFWFHPLVWWMGARLVEARERACDEDVLALGGEPRDYATGILKVCEFCLRAPLPCMSGVTGGDLKKRMVWIMTNRVLHKLGLGKKLALGVVALGSVAGPFAIGLVHASEARSGSEVRSAAVVSAEQAAEHASLQVSKQEMSMLVIKKVPPAYPPAARKAHIQGEVILRATVGRKGDVENLQVVSGPAELAPAAVEAVKQWKYRPYMKDGRAVEVETDITVNFTLME